MKKILIVFISFLAILVTSCKKDSLDLINPNEPGVESMKTEEGFVKAAYGVYNSLRAVSAGNNWYYYTWFTQWLHNIMGDVTVSSVGNFGIRWANQTARIIRPSGAVVLPPVGGRQPAELDALNARSFGSDNVQAHEWIWAYSLIGHCNLLLSIMDDVPFRGDAATVTTKKDTYKAWLLYWKGHAYSRLGSIYKQGVITNEYGSVSTTYVPSTALITEANRNFNEAKTILTAIPDGNATYSDVFGKLIPPHFKAGKGGVLTPQMFVRTINTFLARNILVNKSISALTPGDLDAIEALANTGVNATDKVFTIRSASTNCLVYESTWSQRRLNLAWERVSERFVQDIRAGDLRRTRNIMTLADPIVSPNGRGYQYGTRYQLRDVTAGGDWMSATAGSAEGYMAGTYEENQLMLAEVKIRKNQVEQGLAHIDAVRTYQNAGLAPLVGTGLNQAAALEELRSERRVALFLRGLSFYDYRRAGVLKPIAQGGGRTNANVVFEAGVVDACTIEYDYKEWWDVPANETDFNPITTGAKSLNPNLINPL
jgi:hypothetical protein